MATTALYQWGVAGSPVNILLDLPLADRLRTVAAAADAETGGLLLGHFDGNYTVITDFEEFESEHKRGPAYTLSNRDEMRLGSRMEARRKKSLEVVGFFRSHRRPGMYLDEGDNQVLSSRFNNPSQVALLVKPMTDGSAVGGFFFWEDGEINRKQTYLQFPMSAKELEAGEFPLVEPVAGSQASALEPPPRAFDQAETIDSIPRIVEPQPEFAGAPTLVRESVLPPPPVEAQPRKWRLTGPLVGLIAAGAAIAGYLIGTSGSHRDRFGARPGDISLSTAPEPEANNTPPAQAAPTAAATTPANAQTQQMPEKPVVSVPIPAPDAQRRSPMPVATSPRVPPPVIASKLNASAPPVDTSSVSTTGAATAEPAPEQPTSPTPDTWQHFHPQTPPPSQVAIARPNPQPLVVPSTSPFPVTESSVYLEAVESGSMSRAMGKIPLVGVFHHAKSGDNFVPPQAVRSFAPKVPKDLARELTGTLPVDLKLTVDQSGHVSSVTILSHQTAEEFIRLAGDAAYDWRFEPARLKDKPVSSDVIAHFRFRPVL